MKYLKKVVIVILIGIGTYFTVIKSAELLSDQINKFANKYHTQEVLVNQKLK